MPPADSTPTGHLWLLFAFLGLAAGLLVIILRRPAGSPGPEGRRLDREDLANTRIAREALGFVVRKHTASARLARLDFFRHKGP